jgi:hypothetical protein
MRGDCISDLSFSWSLSCLVWPERRPGLKCALNEYSALLQQGVESKKAFQQAFGDFKAMKSQLGDYLSRLTFQVGVMANPSEIR